MLPQANTVLDPQRSEQLHDLALDCYLALVKNVAHYAIEFDDEITGPYRHYVNALVPEIETGRPQALEESRGSLRALLRDYRDKASAYVNRLRGELADTAAAFQRLLETLTQTGEYHENYLRHALNTLHELATANMAREEMMSSLRAATETIEKSLEELNQQQRLTVSQFVIEIGLLHKRIDALEAAVSIDALTKLFTRAEMEQRIRSAEGSGSILVLRVDGVRRAASQFNPAVARELEGAFIKRLRNSLLPDVLIGKWAEEEYLVISSMSNKEAAGRADWICEHLSGAYACLQGGKAVRPTIQVSSRVLDWLPGGHRNASLEEIEAFFAKSKY